MDAEPGQKSAKSGAGHMPAPFCVHVYVWAFMVALSVLPILGHASGSIARGSGPGPFMTAGLIQLSFWIVQRRCSTEELSYWDGLLVAACSVTTRELLASFFRVAFLLLGVVVFSVLFALCHDTTNAQRHAGIRYGRLIIWLHRQRWRA